MNVVAGSPSYRYEINDDGSLTIFQTDQSYKVTLVEGNYFVGDYYMVEGDIEFRDALSKGVARGQVYQRIKPRKLL